LKEDLRAFLDEHLEDLAESHIEAWKDRYWRKSLKSIEHDLTVNHDDSLEIETIEEGIGRELTDDEKTLVSQLFIDKVLDIFYIS
jgi:hypothetical protein